MGFLRRLLMRRSTAMPPDCARVARVLQQYLDAELDEATSSEVLAHLDECRQCGLEADTYRRMKQSVARQADPDADAVARLRDFADRVLAGEVATDGDEDEGGVTGEPG